MPPWALRRAVRFWLGFADTHEVNGWPGDGGGEAGLSGTASLIAIAVSLVLVLILGLVGFGTFSSGSGGPGTGSNGIFSGSNAERQIQLCAEGRDSSYGDPPSPAQQAACVNEIARQAGGGGTVGVPIVPGVPTDSVPGS